MYTCIHVNGNHPDQKLKNLSSERLIPIHSSLIELSFLEFSSKKKQLGHQGLFPELSPHKNSGDGVHLSRWFAGVRKRIGLETVTGKLDFHSFRHTLADHLKQKGVAESRCHSWASDRWYNF